MNRSFEWTSFLEIRLSKRVRQTLSVRYQLSICMKLSWKFHDETHLKLKIPLEPSLFELADQRFSSAF